MATIDLNAEPRDATGSRVARRVRRTGRFPAVLYGPHKATCLLSVDTREFSSKVMVREGSHLIRFTSTGRDLSGRVAVVKETQVDSLSGVPTHADFYEVDLTKVIRVPVPVHLVGKAAGVVNGGILQPILREIEVECLPDAIPDFLAVDVTALGIHDSVHLSQVVLPAGVKAIYEQDDVVVTLLAPTAADTKAEGEAAAAPAAAGAKPAAGGKPAAAGAKPAGGAAKGGK